MPLLRKDDEILLMGKSAALKADLLAETSGRLLLLLSPDAPPGSFRAEVTVHCEVMQGAYRGSFHSRILYCDRDLHTGREVLLLDYPATFRRERLA